MSIDNRGTITNNYGGSGGGSVLTRHGVGMIIAVILSWLKWHSIGWAIVHGLLGWLYVIYYLIKFGFPHQLF